jgi:predicted phosphodiesterase
VRFIRGNADREVLEPSEEAEDGDVWKAAARWVARRLTLQQRDLLARLPPVETLDVDGLGPALFCHGSPRSDEEIITRATSEERFAQMLAGVGERVVVCGHTHVQFDRRVRGFRVVNAGSVGMPYEAAPGAYWALLGPGVELRRTPYDVARAAELVSESDFPAAHEFSSNLTGPTSDEEATEFFEAVAEGRAERS